LAERVISAPNAYIVTDMLRDVISEGSGALAWRELQRRDIAGKSGTTNDGRDTWFVGFTDEIVAGAWVGFDLPRSLGSAGGRSEQGGRTAIPMWIEFMREALSGVPDVEPPRPPGVVEHRINPKTGEIASDLNPNTVTEIFEFGHVPKREPDGLYAPLYDTSSASPADPGPFLPNGPPGEPPPPRSSGPSLIHQ
jgi:penicillin-binding protein 1A